MDDEDKLSFEGLISGCCTYFGESIDRLEALVEFSVCILAEICFFIQFLIKFHHTVDLFLSNFQPNLFSEFFASFNLFIKFVSRIFLYRHSIIRFQLNRNNRKIINVQ